MRLEHEWSTVWSSDNYEEGYKPTPDEKKLLFSLGDKGLLLTSTRGCVNFGVRLKGSKGSMPFVCPQDSDGEFISQLELDEVDSFKLVNAQNWSVMEAYKLGLEKGKEMYDTLF